MSQNLNPNATPFIPKHKPYLPIPNPDWPPMPEENDQEEHANLEGVERLNMWISEWEKSTSTYNQGTKSTPLRKSFPLTDINQPQKKLENRIKLLCTSIEEARDKRQQLEVTIFDLRATIKHQSSLLSRASQIEANGKDFITWQVSAFSTLYRKARTSPDDPFHNIKNSFASPIYPTYLSGCKISFRIFPYGINIFRGTHSSISCELHYSDFTHPQTWPFDKTVEVEILDQKDEGNKWSTLFPINPHNHEDTLHNLYTHPNLLKEDFIPHTKLLVNFREAFLNNDSIIFRIKFKEPSPQSLALHNSPFFQSDP